MSQRRAVARGPRGAGAVKAPSVKEVDPRLTAVADWLRNEKKSGLHTKEAVQYEKVRAGRQSRLARVAARSACAAARLRAPCLRAAALRALP